ncbi:rRNA adenine N-6-methyltransferase family protein [Candidatus Chlorohelix sp.]|uniref:rRNA adenine N-6-methyltransferase family protein n=1 Tax=Candidatus Chlorohelix sp. TaxID=3139201 RepID=UPI003073C8E5
MEREEKDADKGNIPPLAVSHAAELRAQLVELLKQGLAFNNPLIESAFLSIPREHFLPSELTLEKVYSDDAIVVKYTDDGMPSSSSSQPYLMADMLEVLQLAPGMKVLEIGAGVGYNAAIMAYIVGTQGQVISVELDAELAKNTYRKLQDLGEPYSKIKVINADGAEGFEEDAPYDRVIVTVQQWEISPAWVSQLKVGGLLLVPISISRHVWGGLIPCFRKDADGILRAVASSAGGFMPMRGSMLHPLSRRLEPNSELVSTSLPLDPLLPLNLRVNGGKIYVTREATLDKYSPLLGNNKYPQKANGYLQRELLNPAGENWGNNRQKWALLEDEQRTAIGMAQGFNILLAAAHENRICSLLVGSEFSAQEPRNPNERNGIRFDWRGMVVIMPSEDEQALDLAIIINADAVMGWRIGMSDFASNQALLLVEQVWDLWLGMGCPQSSDYRPIAFPADSNPSAPGFIVHRQYFDLLLPFGESGAEF